MANIAAIRFIAFFAGLLGVIFLIVALPTHHWYHHRPYGTNETAITGLHVEEVYGGIFEKCEKMSDSSYSCRATNGNGTDLNFLSYREYIAIIIANQLACREILQLRDRSRPFGLVAKINS